VDSYLSAALHRFSRVFVVLCFVCPPIERAAAERIITLAMPDIGENKNRNIHTAQSLIALLDEAFRRIGCELNIVLLPYDRSLKMVEAGLVDGDLIRTSSIEAQYPDLIRVSEPILEIDLVVVSYAQIDLSAGWNALSNKSIGYLLGAKVIEDNLPDTAVLTGVKTAKQLLDLLTKKRVDYAVMSRSFSQPFLGDNNTGLVASEQSLVTVQNFVYLNETHAALALRLAEALRGMKKDGVFQRIIEQ